MNKQVILITGASGFIGTALIARLKNKYYIVASIRYCIRTRITVSYGIKPISQTRSFCTQSFAKPMKMEPDTCWII